MKKIIILTAISLFAASSAFADTINLTSTGLSLWGAKTGVTAVSGTNLIGKTSTGVGIGYVTASTGYAVVTQHKNGTKAFGSSFDSTAIYSAPVVVTSGANVGATIPTTADSTLFVASGTVWTTM